MMVDDSGKKIIKENISNKKRLKSTIADMYVYDKKIKNLMCLSVDLGIEEMITKKNTLLKQEVFRMAQILCYEYGTDIEDAVVVVHEWADIFDIEYEDDSLFLEAKELMSVNTGDVLNWEKVKDDIFNVISYAYVLGNDTERDSMIENAEQLFGEKDIKSIIIKKIRNICEDDFLKKTLDAPQFLLLDEPLATMDDTQVLNVLDILKSMAEQNTQIFFTTANGIMISKKRDYIYHTTNDDS